MKHCASIVLGGMACLWAAGAGNAWAQQDYPNRPIRIIVPFPPGGSTDPMARMVAAKLMERWGGTIVVDNRPGANTIIGSSIVAKAAQDGYTMLWAGASLFSGPSLIPHLPYDVVKDFVGVTTVVKTRIVLVVHPTVTAKSLKELVALAKAKPGQLNYGSSGIGTNVHLSGASFALTTGVDLQHIPYKGSGPLSTDLLGGRIHMSFQVPITVIPFINAGKLRPIAITGEARLSVLPEVPTFAEAGLPGFGWSAWQGLAAPAGTPLGPRSKLATEMASILKSPETIDFIARQGAEPLIADPNETTALIKADVERYGRIVKAANIKWTP
jgi:tripartite-type tricarboxylate transporter receptor subunit TctC